MPLTAGPRLSFYETLGSQRAGGMGEVYRSEDTRYEREAKSLADRIARGALRLELSGDLLESALVAPRPPSSRAVAAAFTFLALIAGPVFAQTKSLKAAIAFHMLKNFHRHRGDGMEASNY